jgi:hypothetical protein
VISAAVRLWHTSEALKELGGVIVNLAVACRRDLRPATMALSKELSEEANRLIPECSTKELELLDGLSLHAPVSRLVTREWARRMPGGPNYKKGKSNVE